MTPDYNLVILPVLTPTGTPAHQVSATSRRTGVRIISPPWSAPELHSALTTLHLTPLNIHELQRGNRMIHSAHRNPTYRLFTQSELLAIGLTPIP